MVEQIKVLEQNKKGKQSKGLMDILDGKINDLVTYCKKYNRSIDKVINDYELSENVIYAIS